MARAKRKIYNPTYTKTSVKVAMQNVLAKNNDTLSLTKFDKEFINEVLLECDNNVKEKTAK